ncbi:MAG: phosphatidic acid phosphatase [Lachnospiraceae bacterium]|nr:phosphatidic acid phosphatase [Lachnospiraceae bacterium]
MRNPVVDYRSFKLSKINEPQYRHLLLLLGWPIYFALYFITEQLIPLERCYPIHCFLDDIVPFCEYFVIAYAGWYFLIVGSLIYLALYNPDNFKGMMKFIITTQVVAMIIYIIFPNRQDLRPTEFVNENLFTFIMGLIYKFDTSTNVCPSLHVAYSIGIASTFLKEKSVSKLSKTLITVFCFMICISVAFVKQHSVVDIFAAIPVCILAEWIAFGGYWKEKAAKKTNNT